MLSLLQCGALYDADAPQRTMCMAMRNKVSIASAGSPCLEPHASTPPTRFGAQRRCIKTRGHVLRFFLELGAASYRRNSIMAMTPKTTMLKGGSIATSPCGMLWLRDTCMRI